ncbi:MAG: transcriptional regulator MntR [Thaumarchaeota archaeon]|nr:transcriptional regulator MntR [Nitrososphaerota archaeon]
MTATRKRALKKTPRSEDYLETVHHLIRDKGYAKTTDISAKLDVKPPTVTSMLGKLAAKGYLLYEPYRGMKLTDKGEKAAVSVIRRHEVISGFLSMLGVDDRIAYQDTEGIEHHVHPETMERIERMAEYLRRNPRLLRSIRDYVDRR